MQWRALYVLWVLSGCLAYRAVTVGMVFYDMCILLVLVSLFVCVCVCVFVIIVSY